MRPSGHDRAGRRLGRHHHDANDSSLYDPSGILRLEFEGEAEPLDAHVGDLVHAPAFTAPGEQPGDEPSLAVIAGGRRDPTVNVDAARHRH